MGKRQAEKEEIPLQLFARSEVAAIWRARTVRHRHGVRVRLARRLACPLQFLWAHRLQPFYPTYRLGNNLLAYLAERAGSYAFYETEVWIKSLPTFAIAAITLVTVGVLAARRH